MVPEVRGAADPSPLPPIAWPDELPLAAVASPVSVTWPGSGYGNKAYTGREWDPEIQAYYYRARYYDPKIGRFISEDPVRFLAGINFYAYVHNRPTVLIDPFGLAGQTPQATTREKMEDLFTAGLWDTWHAWEITKDVWDRAPQLVPEGRFDGPQDAFRHCLWSCRLATEINQDDAQDITDSHESANRRAGQSSAQEGMDQNNNAVGRACANVPAGGSCEDKCMLMLQKNLLQTKP